MIGLSVRRAASWSPNSEDLRYMTLGITVTFDPSTGNKLGFVNPIELEPPSAAGVEPAA
jgi:hypothetical protein